MKPAIISVVIERYTRKTTVTYSSGAVRTYRGRVPHSVGLWVIEYPRKHSYLGATRTLVTSWGE